MLAYEVYPSAYSSKIDVQYEYYWKNEKNWCTYNIPFQILKYVCYIVVLYTFRFRMIVYIGSISFIVNIVVYSKILVSLCKIRIVFTYSRIGMNFNFIFIAYLDSNSNIISSYWELSNEKRTYFKRK